MFCVDMAPYWRCPCHMHGRGAILLARGWSDHSRPCGLSWSQLRECFCKYSQIYVWIYENHLNFSRMFSLPLFQENTCVLSVNQSHKVCHYTEPTHPPCLCVAGWLLASKHAQVWDPALNQLVRVTNTLASLPLPSLAEVPPRFSSATKD